MKRILPAFAFLAALFLYSCEEDSPFPEYEKAGNGTYFLVHKKGAGTQSPDTGSVLFLTIKLKTATDSVFADINKNSGGQPFFFMLTAPKYKGDHLDLMSTMHTGDSLSCFLLLDSLNKYFVATVMGRDGQPHQVSQFKFNKPELDTMKYLGMTFRLDSFYSAAKYKAFVRREDSIADARERMVLQMEDSLLRTYLATNKMAEKPDPSGIWFKELKAGTGKPLEQGAFLGVKYTGKYLDGSVFDSNDKPGAELLPVELGRPGIIEGFQLALMKMKKGGKAIVILPSELGYNDGRYRIFELEVVEAMSSADMMKR